MMKAPSFQILMRCSPTFYLGFFSLFAYNTGQQLPLDMISKENSEDLAVSADVPTIIELDGVLPGSVALLPPKTARNPKAPHDESFMDVAPKVVQGDGAAEPESLAVEQELEKAWHEAERERQDQIRQRQLWFETFCTMLRNNDPSITHVDACDFPSLHHHELAQSLVNNTIVSTVSLDVSSLDGFVACNPVETEASFGHYLTSSTGSRRVELFSAQHGSVGMGPSSSYSLFADCHVLAIVKNPYIEQLVCHCGVGSHALRSLLLTSSLQVLEIDLDLVPCLGPHSDDLATAFGRNKTITSLKLRVRDKRDLMESILTKLREEGSCLSSLVLCGRLRVNPRYMGAAQLLLRSSQHLKMFGMEDIFLPEETMYLLVDGLRHSLVDRLSMENCVANRDAIKAFIAYMQTPVATVTENGVVGHCLRELFMASDQRTVARKCVESVAAAMMQNLATDTMGSRLRSLSLRSCRGLAGFYESVADSSVRFDLERLELGTLCCIDCAGLSNVLPLLPSLSQLVIDETSEDAVAQLLLDGMQRNASLHRVLIRQNDSASFTTADLARVDAYCTRNQEILNVLRAPKDSDTESQAGSIGATLLPVLFLVAGQTPTTKLSSMLAGLLASGDSIGWHTLATVTEEVVV
jgi:hypothetical protein